MGKANSLNAEQIVGTVILRPGRRRTPLNSALAGRKRKGYRPEMSEFDYIPNVYYYSYRNSYCKG